MASSEEQFRRQKGCNSCRTSKVKCGDQRPSCARCIRLRRECSWPPPRRSLNVDRFGPVRGDTYREVRPAVELATAAQEFMNSFNQSDSLDIMDSFPGNPRNDQTWDNIGTFSGDLPLRNPPMNTSGVGSSMLMGFMAFNSITADQGPSMPQGFGGIATSDTDALLKNLWSMELANSIIHRSLSDHHLPIANSLTLSNEGRNALQHYQTTFSTYRTTKAPRWSTHRLLLDKADDMIMRFILAVSINDICNRKEQELLEEAQDHFAAGEMALYEALDRDLVESHIPLMVGFLLLFLYMPKQSSFPRESIYQLSRTVTDYVRKHRLDSRCLEQPYGSWGGSFSEADRTLLARLIIWIYDEDVKCGFQGYGGYFAAYLTAHRERTMAVCDVSRTALKAHFDTTFEGYPEDQVRDDDDNAMELEFLWALTALWQDINELSTRMEIDDESVRRIKQRFKMLKKKYSMVFQLSAEPEIPRTRRTHINADYDVVLYNALQVYFFRTTITDLEMETPQEIQLVLEDLLHIGRRTFVSNRNELHDRLEWPLFLAGIEIEDPEGFKVDWIEARLSKRPRLALQTIIKLQESSPGKRVRLEMSRIRSLLNGGIASDFSAFAIDELDFLDSVTTF